MLHLWVQFLKFQSIVGQDFPGGLVVKNLPASEGDMDSILGPGTEIPQALGHRNHWGPHSLESMLYNKLSQWEACAVQLEKARSKQRQHRQIKKKKQTHRTLHFYKAIKGILVQIVLRLHFEKLCLI